MEPMQFVRSPYTLMTFELRRVNFSTTLDDLKALVTACPHLHTVKWKLCKGTQFAHIKYMISNAHNLTHLECNWWIEDSMEDIAMKIETNHALKTLVLEPENGFSFRLDDTLILLNSCPALETLSLQKFSHFAFDNLPYLVSTCWLHLQRITLDTCCQVNHQVIELLCYHCADTLRDVHMINYYQPFTDTSLKLMCHHLYRLEVFEVFDMTTVTEEEGIACLLTQCSFKHTLHTLKLTHLMDSLFTIYKECYNLFPALKNIR